MRFVNVDLNLLRVFDAIYTQRNLTKAADTLCITQPAVSHALARLRDLYGDPLFARTPDGMKPTAIADEIYVDVCQALQHFRSSLARGVGFRPELTDRRYRFGMGEVVEARIMPALLHALQECGPRVGLEVYQHPRRDAVRELVAGRLDFALDNVLPQHPHVLHSRLFSDEYVCVVRHDHPTVRGSITLDQYVALGHITASSRRGGMNYVDSALQELGLTRRVVLQTQNYLETPRALIETDHVLTVTRSVAAQFDVQILKLPFAVPPLVISLYWHASSAADPGSVWMRKLILRLFQASEDEDSPSES